MANCTKCGRPKSSKDALVTPYELCCAETVNGDESCEVVAAAYRRGLLRGVEIAKERLDMVDDGNGYDSYRVPDWTDVDRAVREEIGDGKS